jgi:uncharacterized protein DUF6788
MHIPKHPTLLKRMTEARVRQLTARGVALGASLVTIRRRCGRPGCHCAQGALHEGYYLTRAVAGKTRTVYVPRELVDEVRGWIAEHRRLKQVMRELTELALARVAGHVRARKRRAGRP